jgi:hypothetical protein
MTEFIVDKLSNERSETNCVFLKKKSLDYIKIENENKIAIFKVMIEI